MREFNTTGICVPEQHYMVNLDERIKAIKKLVDSQKYFVMNRARQYGKTTTLFALEKHLLKDYFVVSLDFQKLGNKSFAGEVIFSKTFADIFSQKLMKNKGLSGEMHDLLEKLHATSREEQFALYNLFSILSELCQASPRPIVLMIDEVDSATNNQVFLDFLAQLRAYYMERFSIPTFQSVILAGVYDIKNLKRKTRTDEEHKINSPWNIATEFDMDMSFSAKEIDGMLSEYENDYHTGMDISCMSKRLYDYTSGYPFLVSKLCKYMAEQYESDGIAWTTDGFLTAERKLLNENNTLFDSLTEKLAAYPQLNDLVFSTLYRI